MTDSISQVERQASLSTCFFIGNDIELDLEEYVENNKNTIVGSPQFFSKTPTLFVKKY